MSIVYSLIPERSGDLTSDVIYISPPAEEQSYIKADWTPAEVTSSVVITVYGRATDLDAWATLVSFTEADFGAGTDPYSSVKEIISLPQVYVNVSQTTNKLATTAITLMARESHAEGFSGEHVFDLASKVPATFHAMHFENWLGLLTADTIGGVVTPGPDASYNQWEKTDAKKAVTGWNAVDPVNYPTDPYANHFPAVCGTSGHTGMRAIGSRYNPYNGIYTSSYDQAEGTARLDNTLGILRQSGNYGARVDCIAPTCISLKYTTRFTTDADPNYDEQADIRYRGLNNMMARCDALGYTNCVLAQYAAPGYWIYHLDDMTEIERRDAAVQDMIDVINEMKNKDAAYRIDGRLVFSVFINGDNNTYVSAEEWGTMLNRVRSVTGEDFYALTGYKDSTYFKSFDGIYPWVSFSTWATAVGGTDLLKAADWATDKHESFLNALASYPGRIVLGQIIPGFDDWTKNYGAGEERVITRSSDLISGQFDGLIALRTAGKEIKGIWSATWDDWHEGTVFDATVEEGTTLLETLTEEVGAFYSDTVAPAETAAFAATFVALGIVRLCP